VEGGSGVGVVDPDQEAGGGGGEDEDEARGGWMDGSRASERVATRLGVWVGLLGVDEIEADFPFSYSLSLPSGPAQSCLVHLAFIIFIYLFIYSLGLLASSLY
jgi:hypothetical protein